MGLKHKDAQRLCQRRAKTWDSIFSKVSDFVSFQNHIRRVSESNFQWENHQIENPTDDDEGEFGFHDDDWDIKDDPILGAANRNDTDSESNDEEEEDSDMQSAIASVYQMAKANLKPAKRRNKENQDPNGSIIGQFEQMSCSTPKQKNGGRRAVKTEKDPDLVCTHCEKQTGLPREALEGTGQVAETFLCNHCVIEQSGHRDCTVEDCEACETIGAEMTRRSYFEFGEVSRLFQILMSKPILKPVILSDGRRR